MENTIYSKCWYKDVCTADCNSSCLRYLEMKYLMDNSGIPENKQTPIQLYVSDIDRDAYLRLNDIKLDISNFVESGKNLYVASNKTGNGKTSWALKLLLKYFDEVWAGNGFRVRGLFVHVPTLLLQLKNFQEPLSQEYRNNLYNADLVVFDDLGGIKLSAYDYANLLAIIDNRLLNQKSCIFTANHATAQELDDAVGVKIGSRIYHLSEVIILRGEGMRHGSASDIE